MTDLTFTTLQEVSKERHQSLVEWILIYGAPGCGKTRFATSLTERFGNLAYIAIDKGGFNLDSVLAHHRERIVKLVEIPNTANLQVACAEIAITPWKQMGVDTLIIDTLSNLAENMLREGCKNNAYQKSHRTNGLPPDSPGYVALPDKGDYGGVQSEIKNMIGMLERHQEDINVVVLCHETEIDHEKFGTIGGPKTVGKELVRWLASEFKTVIRLDREHKTTMKDGKLTPTTNYMARMGPHGAWIARRNEASPTGNPLVKMDLDIDPINFWRKYDETSPILKKEPTQ